MTGMSVSANPDITEAFNNVKMRHTHRYMRIGVVSEKVGRTRSARFVLLESKEKVCRGGKTGLRTKGLLWASPASQPRGKVVV